MELKNDTDKVNSIEDGVPITERAKSCNYVAWEVFREKELFFGGKEY